MLTLNCDSIHRGIVKHHLSIQYWMNFIFSVFILYTYKSKLLHFYYQRPIEIDWTELNPSKYATINKLYLYIIITIPFDMVMKKAYLAQYGVISCKGLTFYQNHRISSYLDSQLKPGSFGMSQPSYCNANLVELLMTTDYISEIYQTHFKFIDNHWCEMK